MAAFSSKVTTLAAVTATKVVDAADFDHMVFVNGSGNVRIAFSGSDAPTGVAVPSLALSTSVNAATFALPADEELWAYSSSADSISVFVTAIAR